MAISNEVSNKPTPYIAETGWPTASMTPENATLGAAVAGVSELQTFLNTYPCQANANSSYCTCLASRFRSANDSCPVPRTRRLLLRAGELGAVISFALRAGGRSTCRKPGFRVEPTRVSPCFSSRSTHCCPVPRSLTSLGRSSSAVSSRCVSSVSVPRKDTADETSLAQYWGLFDSNRKLKDITFPTCSVDSGHISG